MAKEFTPAEIAAHKAIVAAARQLEEAREARRREEESRAKALHLSASQIQDDAVCATDGGSNGR